MPFRWGIFGTGQISAKFVAGLRAARNAEACFVASRSLARAEQFARGTGVPRAIEGYAAAAAAGGVDAIYIATPPSEHAAHAMLCIDAGVPVLVEKPFASCAADAARVAKAARERNVFAMEGMWTRFIPAAQAMKEAVASGAVGEVRMIAGSFGTSKVPDTANGSFSVPLGGGAIAHLGTYLLSLGQWLFGSPTLVQALGRIGDSGVEEDAVFQLTYGGKVGASFFASFRAWAPNTFHVMGTDGIIGFQGSLVRPSGLRMTRQSPLRQGVPGFGWRARLREHGLTHRIAQIAGISSRAGGRSVHVPYRGNGFQYEAEEVSACIARGEYESRVMPLADSIAVAATADLIRDEILASMPKRNPVS